MDMDMNQFLQVFIEESTELLETIEEILVDLGDGDIDDNGINSIFRCAHSIKGGSATFGLKSVSEFTHVVETYLDKVRDGIAHLDGDITTLLLDFVDMTREMLHAAINAGEYDEARASDISLAFQALIDEVGDGKAIAIPDENSEQDSSNHDEGDDLQALFDAMKENPDADANVETGSNSIKTGWRIYFKPSSEIVKTGNEPLRIINELSKLGDLKTILDTEAVPSLSDLVIDNCYLEWCFEIYTDISEQDLKEDIFSWVLMDSDLSFEQISRDIISTSLPGDDAVTDSASKLDEALNVDKSKLADSSSQNTAPGEALPSVASETPDKAPAKKAAAKNSDMASIRVATDKVDALIDIVGELIITQSMLTQIADGLDGAGNAELKRGITQLKLNSRELQESVMRIRMLPIGFIFNRFPRLIRDISRQLGKQIKFVVSGESTELDKGILEKLSDPMVHLIRNGLDHGIETAQRRKASGKPEEGTLSIHAYHQGGCVIIELQDDGAGINKERVLSKAVENGLIDASTVYTDREINNMIFMPGFSTADVVTDISGRGVGMDVVRRNIHELGGVIEVESVEGQGSKFTIRLPLTLSILDGQLTNLNNEVYILPLTNIIESIQITPDQINRITDESQVYSLRNEFIPLIGLKEIFSIPYTENTGKQFVVVIEAKSKKYGLLVDELASQQQVVLKSIDSNYKQIEGISGATILGDGTIALIIDVEGVVNAYERYSNNYEINSSAVM